jgi:hypothetical protein
LFQQALFAFEIALCLAELGLGLRHPGRNLPGADPCQKRAFFHSGSQNHRDFLDGAGYLGADGRPLE